MQNYPFAFFEEDASSIVQALSEYGIAVLPGYLDNSRVTAIEKEVRRLLADHPPYAHALGSYPDGNGIRVEREQVSNDCPQLGDVFDQPWMREVAKIFFGTQPYVFNHDLNIALDMIGTDHLAHQVHYDRMHQLKFFLYLTDTSIANGAFHCLPGSQRHAKKVQRDNRRRLKLPTSFETRLCTPEFKQADTGGRPRRQPNGHRQRYSPPWDQDCPRSPALRALSQLPSCIPGPLEPDAHEPSASL